MKINTSHLGIALVVLLLMYAGVQYFSKTGRSKSLRSELVSLDPVKISKILISNTDGSITLEKQGDNWYVSNDNYTYPAQENKVASVVATLETITPSRMATKKTEKWKEFQVDSTGLRVKVFQADEKVLDIVLGRLGMESQQKYHTYVRLSDENDVYVANNFMSYAISNKASSYRNSQLISIPMDSITAIKFDYPDSSFTLNKSLSNQWMLGDSPADSAKTASFVQQLAGQSSTKMFDGNPQKVVRPEQKIAIQMQSGDIISLQAEIAGDSVYLQSSQNTEVLFADNALYERIFKGKSAFIPEVE